MERSEVSDICFLIFSWCYKFKQSHPCFNYFLKKGFPCSKFGDIYDEEYFIDTLANDVRVVDTVPEYLMERFDYNLTNVYNFRVKAWAPTSYYRDSVLPKLLEEK